MLTRQEALNRVMEHLRKQGKPAVNESGLCLYRTADGLMCAIGALIPDDKYHPKIDQQLIMTFVLQLV